MDEGGYEFVENLTLLQKEDVVVVIGFRRIYEELLTAIDYARLIGCPVFAVTENPLSQLTVMADDHKEQKVTGTIDNLEWLNMQLKKIYKGEKTDEKK